ncbi:MAG: protoporphyrinogen oxidase [Candidatus Omnitrophica bacterium]|nr:protoporphyrinogen oxidase [Candidatus Omnitrophota bacterium]MBI3010081.1 protoporphyrinogen oxidase [Candidatus Omnitrophota bacterium]
MHPKRVVVIGSGVSGLTVAFALLERSRHDLRPMDLKILEASNRPGGVIRSYWKDGFLFEQGPERFSSEPAAALSLCRLLGLEDDLELANSQSIGLMRDGRVFPLPDLFKQQRMPYLDLLKGCLLSISGKGRAILERWIKPCHFVNDESVDSFIRRRFGREVLERWIEPLLRIMASGSCADLSMRAILPHWLEAERRYGSVLRALKRPEIVSVGKEALVRIPIQAYRFRSGMQTLIDRLVSRLAPVPLLLQHRLMHLERRNHRSTWRLVLDNGESMEADAVCLALPAQDTAKVVKNIDPQLSKALAGIPYSSWVTVSMAIDRGKVSHPIVLKSELVLLEKKMNAIIGYSIRLQKQELSGQLAATARVFMEKTAEHFSDSRCAQLACQLLERRLHLRESPSATSVNRLSSSIPEYRVGHLERVSTIEERLKEHPTLALTGNGFWGHGVADCIRLANRSAGNLYTSLYEKANGASTD